MSSEIRYGKLVIDSAKGIRRISQKNGEKRRCVYAVCDCGNEKWVRVDQIKTGKHRTCGRCNRSEQFIGQKFNSWIVEKIYSKYFNERKTTIWLCRCVCGNLREVVAATVKNGASKSCGCTRNRGVDLIGEQFGHLIVLGKAPNGAWLCECSCGDRNNYSGPWLRSKGLKSCGCINWRRLKSMKGMKHDFEMEAGEFSDEEREVMKAVELFKRANRAKFVTPTEVLEIVKKLGYRKVKTQLELGQVGT